MKQLHPTLLISALVPFAIRLSILVQVLKLPFAQAAHARKRPTVTVRSNINKYDRQITTFDPSGHLLQVEYAHESTKRGNTCAFVNYNNDVIVAVVKRRNYGGGKSTVGDDVGGTSTSTPSFSIRNGGDTGMYRISDGIFCKMTGLEGDGRLLARHLQSTAHQLAWTEGIISSSPSSVSSEAGKTASIYVNQIAKICGEVQHSLTIRSGARPLGIDVVLMGKITSDRLGLFHCTVGGTVNQCEFCACGMDSNLVLRALDSLAQNLNDKNKEEDELTMETGLQREEMNKPSLLQKLIKDVSQIVLKPIRDKNNIEVNFDDTDVTSDDAIDIYVISLNPKCRGGIQTSCAIAVQESDIDNVALLFEEDFTNCRIHR
jgi:20S proteasome alpha/beta subunit